MRRAAELASSGLQCLASVRLIDNYQRSRRELELTSARLVPLASLLGYASSEVEQHTARVAELAEELADVPASAAALGATWFVRMVRGECRTAKSVAVRLAG